MKYVDLFAGCGGLSLGIEASGGELLFAVEKSDMAARSFHHNFIGDMADERAWGRYVASELEDQVAAKVVVRPLADVLSHEEMLHDLAREELDLVVGGPPCQGFSMAGRRDKHDLRNRLAWEYLTFVERTSPKAVVIENVVGMSRSFIEGEDSSFNQLQLALTANGASKYGYAVQPVLVNAVHYGAPQFRPRLMLIAVRDDIAAAQGITVTSSIWKSDFVDRLNLSQVPPLAPVPTTRSAEAFTIRDAISDLQGWEGQWKGRNDLYRARLASFNAPVRAGRIALGEVPNQNLRRHSERVATRFSFYRMLLDNGLDQTLLSSMSALPEDLARELAKSKLSSLRPPLELSVTDSGKTKVLDTLDELIELALDLRTKKHSQKVLPADQPSRTVVTLPDDYGHPISPRTFTVRELARFQGFPDSFEFVGRETTGANRRRVEVPQYTQVGNAVSPWQSLAVGKRLAPIIRRARMMRAEGHNDYGASRVRDYGQLHQLLSEANVIEHEPVVLASS